MAIRHLLTLGRRSKRGGSELLLLLRFLSSCCKETRELIYYEQLENSDKRFLKHNSPYLTLPDHTPYLSAPLTRLTTLPNGLRVATESSLSSRTATVAVCIDTGTRFEKTDDGTAHFLEHMFFQGTRTRTARQLGEEIENIGGHLNAHTSREQTTIYARVLDQHVPQALDILADILQNSEFDDNRIEFVRNVILREMEEVEAEEVIFDHLHAKAFEDSPLGRTILGPVDKVKTITKEDLRNYISTNYTAPRMVIVACGAVKHEEIVEQVNSIFTKLSESSTSTSQLVAREPAIFTSSQFKNYDEDAPLGRLAVAFEGASWTDPDSTTLMVMQAMLGTYTKSTKSSGVGKFMDSALVKKLDVNKTAESMMTFNTNYKDTGLFGVYAVAKPDCLEYLANSIMYEVTRLGSMISEREVARARNQLKSVLLLRMDGTSPVAEDIGRQLLTYGRRIPYAELFARIDSVNASTVKRVANRFILGKEIAIAAVGRIVCLPGYNWFKSRATRFL